MRIDKQKVIFFDWWNLLVATNAAVNILNSNSEQIGMYLGTLNMLRSVIDKYKPSKVVICMDGPQAGERRRKLYKGYKGGSRVKNKTSSVIIYEGEEEN